MTLSRQQPPSLPGLRDGQANSRRLTVSARLSCSPNDVKRRYPAQLRIKFFFNRFYVIHQALVLHYNQKN